MTTPKFSAHFTLQEDHLEMRQYKDRHGVCIITDEQDETARLFFEWQSQLEEGAALGVLSFLYKFYLEHRYPAV